MKLSDIRTLHLRPKPRIVLHDNRTQEGAVSGLDEVPVQLGEQSLTVNLAKATEVRLSPAVETEVVWYTLRVRQDDREILRHSESLRRIAHAERRPSAHLRRIMSLLTSRDG